MRDLPYRAPLILLLSTAFAVVEVAARTTPRLGLSTAEVLTWLGLNAALMLAWALLLSVLISLVPLFRRHFHGLLLAGLLLPQATLWYRFDLFLNEFLYEPKVWGGLLGISLLCLVSGFLLQKPLMAAGRVLSYLALVMILTGAGAALHRARPLHRSKSELPRPDVLVVTLDTVRADILSPWGGPTPTPTLDRLAREGILFEKAIATAPLTEASHLAMLTGVLPIRSGVVSNGTPIGERPALISHAFKMSGYSTAAFVAGFPLHNRYGWAQGFDVYDDDFGDVPGMHRLSLVKAWDQVTLPAHTPRERRGDRVLDRALRWLRIQKGGPVFCWVHLFDPHGPYEAPAPFHPTREPGREGAPLELPGYWSPALRGITDSDWFVEAYQGEIRYTDALLGELIADLERRGRLDQTVILVVADHGESLGEHDYWFEHGDNLLDPSLHVPLILRHPALLPQKRVPCQVSTVDIAPTLLELARIRPPTVIDGHSLLPYAELEHCEERDALASTTAGRFMGRPPVDHALRVRNRKYIQHDPKTDPPRPPELYDLEADPGERLNVHEERPSEASALRSVLDRYLAQAKGVQEPMMDAQTQEALRALGYIE